MRRLIGKIIMIILVSMGLSLLWVRFLPVPTTLYMWQEARQNNGVKYDWIDTRALPAHVTASFIAAEDSGFCHHNGIEWGELGKVLKQGAPRGASTISQQMVKNTWLWQGQNRISRSVRKLLEIPITMIVDRLYPKSRVMKVYLNVIEFDTGVFGIEAAAWHHFNKSANDLTAQEAALLAAVLPNPKGYSAVPPSQYVKKRAAQIQSGAQHVIANDLNDCLKS